MDMAVQDQRAQKSINQDKDDPKQKRKTRKQEEEEGLETQLQQDKV